MNGLTEKMHVTAMGNLRPADIGGDAREGCPNNNSSGAAVLISGVTRQATQTLFGDCEIVPVGTLARIAELEQQVEARGGAIRILESDLKESETRVAELDGAIQRRCRNCWANKATDAAQCRLCGMKQALKGGGEMNPKCEYCNEWNDAAGCQSEILCPFDDKPRNITNGDRFRAMSNEELAEYLETGDNCPGVVTEDAPCRVDEQQTSKGCWECWRKWLDAEVEQ